MAVEVFRGYGERNMGTESMGVVTDELRIQRLQMVTPPEL